MTPSVSEAKRPDSQLYSARQNERFHLGAVPCLAFSRGREFAVSVRTLHPSADLLDAPMFRAAMVNLSSVLVCICRKLSTRGPCRDVLSGMPKPLTR